MSDDAQERLRVLMVAEAVLAYHIAENNTEALNAVFERVSEEIKNIHGRISTKDRAREVLNQLAISQGTPQKLLN